MGSRKFGKLDLFRRILSSGPRQRRAPVLRTRPLGVESLENRLLLADASIDLTGNAGPYTLEVKSSDTTKARVINSSSTVVGSEFTISSTNVVTIKGQSSTKDTLTIDFTNGNPFPQGAGGKVVFEGENPTAAPDKLIIKKGDFATVTITDTGTSGSFPNVPRNDGKVELDGDVLEFTNLASLINTSDAPLSLKDDTSIDNLVFNLPANISAAQIGDNATSTSDGLSQIQILKLQYPSFASTEFVNPTESLTINLGWLDNMITVKEMDTKFAPSKGFTIVGNSGADTFKVESPQPILLDGGPGGDHLEVTGTADTVTLIHKAHDGQSGSVLVAPGATTPKGPVAFEDVEYVKDVTPGARVVELDADPLETNDTRQNATPYELLSQLHVQPTIDPGGDEDWYSFDASEKSSYKIDLQFELIDNSGNQGLPDDGELELEVYEWNSTTSSWDVVQPVGTNEFLLKEGTHYAKVSGVGTAVNLYSLEITNTRETFENGAGQFKPLSGLWTIDREGFNASYRGAADPKDNAIAQFTGAVPARTEARSFEVTIKADEMIAGPRWSNAFIVFDFDPANANADFKFAGAFMGIDKWSIGQRANNANGYDHLIPPIAQRFDAITDYRIRVDITPLAAAPGVEPPQQVDLYVHNGYEWSATPVASCLFSQGFTHDEVGLLTMRGIAWFDDFADPNPDSPVVDPVVDEDPVELNSVPVAGDDSASTNVGQAITIHVLANDTDLDGDPLVPSVVTAAAHGTITPTADGSFLYTPDSGFQGTDTFTYKVSDGQADSDPVTVSVVVNRANAAPLATHDEANTNEDAAVMIDVLANDSDSDGDGLQVTDVTQAGHGVVVVNYAHGTVTYTPNENFNGQDTFSYTISDGHGGLDTGTVSVVVHAVNDPPVARNDVAQTAQEAAVNIDVLANDTDADLDPLTIQIVAETGGSAVVNDGGTPLDVTDDTVTFTPADGFRGTAGFTYRLNDGQVDSGLAEVTVMVARLNHAPTASDDSATLDEDAQVTIDALANDTDPDADPLEVISFTQGARGAVALSANGTLTYTPEPNFDQTDSFHYTIGDGYGGTATATVAVVVNPVNDPPEAAADTRATAEDTPITIDVVANDSDVDGEMLGVQSVTNGAHGIVTNHGNGTVTYAPETGYRGDDSFDYTVSDGKGGIDTATVTVHVGGLSLEEDFDDGLADRLVSQSGKWSISGNQYLAEKQQISQNVISLLQIDDLLPQSLQFQVTFNTDPISSTRWSNAFLVFDYKSPTDFKFAGAFCGIDYWTIGRMTPQGYVMDRSVREPIDSGKYYQIELVLDGQVATLKVGGETKVSYTYAHSFQDGQLGLSTFRGNARFDDLSVKQL